MAVAHPIYGECGTRYDFKDEAAQVYAQQTAARQADEARQRLAERDAAWGADVLVRLLAIDDVTERAVQRFRALSGGVHPPELDPEACFPGMPRAQSETLLESPNLETWFIASAARRLAPQQELGRPARTGKFRKREVTDSGWVFHGGSTRRERSPGSSRAALAHAQNVALTNTGQWLYGPSREGRWLDEPTKPDETWSLRVLDSMAEILRLPDLPRNPGLSVFPKFFR